MSPQLFGPVRKSDSHTLEDPDMENQEEGNDGEGEQVGEEDEVEMEDL